MSTYLNHKSLLVELRKARHPGNGLQNITIHDVGVPWALQYVACLLVYCPIGEYQIAVTVPCALITEQGNRRRGKRPQYRALYVLTTDDVWLNLSVFVLGSTVLLD